MLGGGGVRYLGYVPEGDLPGLYGGAAALVYPSYYEGFGLPAAQAMAAGVPVIASNRSCLPEVVGDAGLLVDPASVEELSEAMERVLTRPELARELAAAGRARAARFHWARCAEESLRVFPGGGGRVGGPSVRKWDWVCLVWRVSANRVVGREGEIGWLGVHENLVAAGLG